MPRTREGASGRGGTNAAKATSEGLSVQERAKPVWTAWRKLREVGSDQSEEFQRTCLGSHGRDLQQRAKV